MSDSDDAYGPPLPPGLSGTKAESSSDEESYGPVLPGTVKVDTVDRAEKQIRVANKPSIGPVLPPHLQEKHKTYDESEESDHVQNVAGPVLPPHLTQISESLSSSRTFKGKKESKKVYGPVIPGNEDVTDDNSDDDDDGLVGPSVFMQAKGEEGSALEDFESRAQKMRDRLTGKDDNTDQPVQRETWMTELPPEMGASFGLTNRTFRKNAAPTGDRSEWTDTPADRERKQKEGHKRKRGKDEGYVPTEKDIRTTKEIEEYNKANRPESLLEMHEKKRKKKKKKEKEKPKERRPFDRDTDLQVNKLDEAQRKAIIKRSQQLGSRFQSGGTGTSFL